MEENKQNNSEFKETLKATSLFGGVQMFNILIQVIRTKFIALLLGPEGMGISNLFSSTTLTIFTITSLGLPRSAVKNISEANVNKGEIDTLKVISVFRKLVWLTGLLGLMVTLVLSPLLSQWTFGNKDYTWGFVILSVTLLFQQITSGQTTVMQGLHKYKYMAKATVVGNTIGLFVTVPLYYFWGVDAIVPVLVLTSIISMLFAIIFYRKIGIKSVPVSKPLMKTEGKDMIIMGVSLSFTSMVNTALGYLIIVFIERLGGVGDVGLFSAGFAIVNTYVGLVMSAMSTDYYPRLCSVNKDISIFNATINNQLEIGFIIIAPLISIFIILSSFIIILLYSTKFLPAEEMIYLAMFSTFFQMFSFCLSFSFLAKGDSKMFIINELTSDLYIIPTQLLGYYLLGLTGIGVAYILNFALYSLQVFLISKFRYGVKVNSKTLFLFIKQLPILIACLMLVLFDVHYWRFIVGIPLIGISVYISYKELNNQMNIKEVVVNKFCSRKNKKNE